ncbi:hypothetical protein HLB09_16195, partial [Pseudokineococcus marinus]|nr:hypothetical protein [Pseudokineococcus marinus]
LLAATAAAAVVTAVVLALLARPAGGAPAGQVVTAGHPVLGLGLLALGALVGAGDFTTGAATTTYAAVPRRLPVLGAQAVLTAVAALLTGSTAVVGAVVATTGDLVAPGVAATPGALAADGAGLVLHVTGLALLAIGAGALLRRPAPPSSCRPSSSWSSTRCWRPARAR